MQEHNNHGSGGTERRQVTASEPWDGTKWLSVPRRVSLLEEEDGSLRLCLGGMEHEYVVAADQADLLSDLALSPKTLDQLLHDYAADSANNVRTFLSQLIQIGAVVLTEVPKARQLARFPCDSLRSLSLEITNRCNLKCDYCYNRQFRNEQPLDLPLDGLMWLLDEAAESGVDSILLTGGEPLLHPHLAEAIAGILSRGMRVSGIFSNGTQDLSKAETAADGPTSRLDFYVSLDGFTAVENARRGERQSIADTILFNMQDAVSRGHRIHVNSVFKEGVDYRAMAEEFRGRGFSTWRIGFEKLRKPPEMLDLESLAAVAEQYEADSTEFAVVVEYFPDRREPILPDVDVAQRYCCDYFKGTMTVRANGQATFCPFYRNGECGVVLREPLLSIWQSRKMRGMRRMRVADVGECAGCPFLTSCQTGCRANALALSGDVGRKDPLGCAVMRSLYGTGRESSM